MATPEPTDEHRHDPGDELLWNESFYLDWFTQDASIGGYVRIGFNPGLGTVWYWACLVGEDRPLVSVIADDVELPRSPSSLELRHDGIWADHVIETALDHMSINLEAFGLQVEDPAENYRRQPMGERVPFGFELDFHTDRAAYLWPPVTPRYEIPCSVHGIILVGDERIEFDGWGQRDHSWGAARDWWGIAWNWTAGRLADGTRWHTAGGFFPGDSWGVAYELPTGETEFVESDQVVIDTELGREGLPTSARLRFGTLDLHVEPVAFAPVLLVHPDGREDRFPRALARFTAADGRRGAGWIEWNQPPV